MIQKKEKETKTGLVDVAVGYMKKRKRKREKKRGRERERGRERGG